VTVDFKMHFSVQINQINPNFVMKSVDIISESSPENIEVLVKKIATFLGAWNFSSGVVSRRYSKSFTYIM